jgi:hypothetical protein
MGKRYKKPGNTAKKTTVKKDKKQSATVKKPPAKETTRAGKLTGHLEEYAQRVWRGLSRKK